MPIGYQRTDQGKTATKETMKKTALTALVIACTISVTGCFENKGLNEAGLDEKTYQPSRVASSVMSFPGGGDHTVYKQFGSFKD
jgi:hypothetical protein